MILYYDKFEIGIYFHDFYLHRTYNQSYKVDQNMLQLKIVSDDLVFLEANTHSSL